MTNSGDCTWFDFARDITAGAGLLTEVRPTTSDKFVLPAERPKYSVLSSARLESYGVKMPGWREALSRYRTHGRHPFKKPECGADCLSERLNLDTGQRVA